MKLIRCQIFGILHVTEQLSSSQWLLPCSWPVW